jgi:hypothetical protein
MAFQGFGIPVSAIVTDRDRKSETVVGRVLLEIRIWGPRLGSEGSCGERSARRQTIGGLELLAATVARH